MLLMSEITLFMCELVVLMCFHAADLMLLMVFFSGPSFPHHQVIDPSAAALSALEDALADEETPELVSEPSYDFVNRKWAPNQKE